MKIMDCNDRKNRVESDSLEQLIAEFSDRTKKCNGDCCEVDGYGKKSLREAVQMAAQAKDGNGRKHSHQWRLRRHALDKAERILSGNLPRIKEAKENGFDSLHETIMELLKGIKWLGELYYYDTAFRIGLSNGKPIYPNKVYLHAGTMKGAIALGINVRGKQTLSVSELKKLFPAFEKLEPHQIEDFLCIKKDILHKFKK